MQTVVSGLNNASGAVCGPATYAILGALAGGGRTTLAPGIDLPALDRISLLVLGGLLAMVAWFISRQRARR